MKLELQNFQPMEVGNKRRARKKALANKQKMNRSRQGKSNSTHICLVENVLLLHKIPCGFLSILHSFNLLGRFLSLRHELGLGISFDHITATWETEAHSAFWKRLFLLCIACTRDTANQAHEWNKREREST